MNFNSTFNDEEARRIAREFKRIGDSHYLDNAGATLYSEQQIITACETLKETLLSNPHTSKETEDLVDQVRYKILKHFNTDSNEYSLIFTSGCTQSLKLVAECFKFGENGIFFYGEENHTSVLGMREVVRTDFVHVLAHDELLKNLIGSVNDEQLEIDNDEKCKSNSLVVFSAQCNFSGFKYPLKLIGKIQSAGLKTFGKSIRGNGKTSCEPSANANHSYYVCLDAASYAATSFLDLAKYKADFVCISFYKMFGYPTGLGALMVSKRGQKVLEKNYFGGGTVRIAMSRQNFHEKRNCFHERFEDGTIAFLSIVELLSGFDTLNRLVPTTADITSFHRISQHTFELAKYCYWSLKRLKYENGRPLVNLYSHTIYESHKDQGPIVTFNLLSCNGDFIGFAEVACIANIYNIILRTGCFCNTGACQLFLGIDDDTLIRQYKAGHVCGDYNDLVDGLPTGAVRVSFGYMTTKQNVDALINMVTDCYLNDDRRRYTILSGSNIPHEFEHVTLRLKRTLSNKVQLKRINIFPVKSCGAFTIKTEWQINSEGFLYDRNWMIISQNGTALTQKNEPRMCLILPSIDLQRKLLILKFQEKSIELPLKEDNDLADMKSASLCQSKVCGDMVMGFDCGNKVATWLSECLSLPALRLIRQANQTSRESQKGVMRDFNLSNQAQFLLINYTSILWLASKVKDWGEVDQTDIDAIVDRFRANIVIETPQPFDENSYENVRIGEAEFKVQGECTRCQMICIDQRSAQKTVEPLRTIAREFNGKIRFGIYLHHKNHNFEDNLFISCSNSIIVD